MPAVQPTATGVFGSTPLANLLIYALDRRLTGTFVIEDKKKTKSAIVVRDGAPIKVKLSAPVARLAEIVVALGVIPLEAAKDANATAKSEGKLCGQVLLARGLLDEATLLEALQEQARRRIEWLAARPPETIYGYYDGLDLLASYGAPEGAPLQPLPFIWRAVRAQADSATVDATLAKLGSRDLRLHAQSRTKKFGFDPREQAVVDVLRAKAQTLTGLISTKLLAESHLKKVIYALVATRHLDLGVGALPVGANESSPVRAVRARTKETGSRTFAGSPKPATSPRRQDTRKSAFRRARTQQQQPRAVVPSVAETAPAGVERLAVAERTGVLGGAPPTEGDDARALRAAAAFKKAEVLVRKGKVAEAEQHAEIAMRNDRGRPEYLAFYADILSQLSDRQEGRDFASLIEMVNEARSSQPDNLKVRLHRARVLSRSGKHEGALREFRYIAKHDASNVEAAREVRLYQMRLDKLGKISKR